MGSKARRGTRANPFEVGESVVLARSRYNRRTIAKVERYEAVGPSGKIKKRIRYLLRNNGDTRFDPDELLSLRDAGRTIRLALDSNLILTKRAFKRFILDTSPKHVGIEENNADDLMKDYVLDEVISEFIKEEKLRGI